MNPAGNPTSIIRCFVGIPLAEARALEPLLQALKAAGRDGTDAIRITAPENLHITLKFLGAVDSHQLEPLAAALEQAAGHAGPLALECRGIGFFKQSVYAGIVPAPELERLAAAIDSACHGLGFPETRPFLPHVTVARFKPGTFMQRKELARTFQQQDWTTIQARQFHLYRSETLPEGARYSVIKRFDFPA